MLQLEYLLGNAVESDHDYLVWLCMAKLYFTLPIWRAKKKYDDYGRKRRTDADDIGGVRLPEELYLSSGFNMHFMADGRVESLDTFLYGWDEFGNRRTYLISYNRQHSYNMTVYLDGETTGTREEEKRLEPLSTVLEQISVKDTVEQWQEREYGILYYGVRSLEGNPEGIVYVDSQGNTAPASLGPSEISGYTVSVFVPEKELEITPVRYLLVDNVMEPEFEQWETSEAESKPFNTDEEFHLSETEYYRLNVIDAALGSRYYALEKRWGKELE